MRSKLLLRIAAGCTAFFAVGHSVGHFTRKATQDVKAQEALKCMAENKFNFGGQLRSYDEFYEGMSLNLIIVLVSITLLLWFLSGIVEKYPAISARLLWPLAIAAAGFSITGFLYFFLVPALTCTVATILILAAIFSSRQNA